MAPRRPQPKSSLGPEWEASRFERALVIGVGAGILVQEGLLMVALREHGMWTAGLEQWGKRFFTLPTEHGTAAGAERALRAHLDGLGDAQWAVALTDHFRRRTAWPARLGWFRRERAEYHARTERYQVMRTTQVRQLPDGSWVLVSSDGFAVGPEGALTTEERRRLLGAA